MNPSTSLWDPLMRFFCAPFFSVGFYSNLSTCAGWLDVRLIYSWTLANAWLDLRSLFTLDSSLFNLSCTLAFLLDYLLILLKVKTPWVWFKIGWLLIWPSQKALGTLSYWFPLTSVPGDTSPKGRLLNVAWGKIPCCNFCFWRIEFFFKKPNEIEVLLVARIALVLALVID